VALCRELDLLSAASVAIDGSKFKAVNAETIPIVMAAIAEPSVLVTSIAHPSGNITGLSSLYSDVTAKRFDLRRRR
jgi:ABC-type uncharacterized transport system substrate-binding protein